MKHEVKHNLIILICSYCYINLWVRVKNETLPTVFYTDYIGSESLEDENNGIFTAGDVLNCKMSFLTGPSLISWLYDYIYCAFHNYKTITNGASL